MTPKPVLLSCILLCVAATSEAQLLKKIKDKVNKTINNDNSSPASGDEQQTATEKKEEAKTKGPVWCDTITADQAGKDGVAYTLAYTGNGNINVLYDESFLGIDNDPNGYRIILTERVNNKTQFVVVENGKVIDTDVQVKPEYVAKRTGKSNSGAPSDDKSAAAKKYIVGDTLKQSIAQRDASSTTIKKIDDDQVEQALAIARQTDDYKNMSDQEKKEFEQTVRDGMAKHNSMAGTTINTPAQQAANVAIVTAYNLVVKGKNYGKFQFPPVFNVSADETKVFAVGVDDKGAPVVVTNTKKTALDKNKFNGSGGYLLRSPDQQKYVYVEMKKMSDDEIEKMTRAASTGNYQKMEYNIVRADGTSITVVDQNNSGQFKLTNSGAVVSIDEKTGQVFADNKSIGKFPLQGRDRLESDAVLVGNDITQMAYYNGEDGSLTYLDGNVKKMDITYPHVVTVKGKSYMSWFRKCRNAIYIARFAF